MGLAHRSVTHRLAFPFVFPTLFLQKETQGLLHRSSRRSAGAGSSGNSRELGREEAAQREQVYQQAQTGTDLKWQFAQQGYF